MRVFSTDEVFGHQVPSLSDFEAALAGFSDAAQLEIDRGRLLAAIVYGSVAIGAQTEQSDLDAILVCPSIDNYSAARAVAAQARSAGNELVPISAIAYTKPMLARGLHEIDRFFGHHLTHGGRTVLGEDISDYITYGESPAAVIFNDYIRNKKRRLSSAILDVAPGAPETLGGIQRMLELPRAVGRKLLRVVDELEGTNVATANSADKQLIFDQAMHIFADLGVSEGAKRIEQASRWYTQILHSAIHGNVTPEVYQAHLDYLYASLPTALQWLEKVDENFNFRVSRQL